MAIYRINNLQMIMRLAIGLQVNYLLSWMIRLLVASIDKMKLVGIYISIDKVRESIRKIIEDG